MTTLPSENLRPPWGRRRLVSGETVDVALGPLHLRLRAEPGEIWIAHHREERLDPAREEPARHPAGDVHVFRDARRDEVGEEPEWVRWATGEEGVSELELRPRLPDRPVVVQPEQAFHVLPGAGARVYIRVPLWVQVLTVGDRPRPLLELATAELSDTWWGDFLHGELCYYLPISARRRIERAHFLPNAAVAPLDLRNRADEDLLVEKVALRVVHLGLFQGDAGLWTDETRADYRGEALGSDLVMSGRPPEEAGGAARVAEPRTPSVRGFRARTFSRLWSLGVGG